MADQEFLASYGVEIDEGGVTRLQNILAQNKEEADALAASFEAAANAVRDFVNEISNNLPTLFSGDGHGITTESLGAGLSIGLDLDNAQKDLEAFIKEAQKPIRMTANFSSAVSAARTAMNNIQSIFAAPITVTVKVKVEGGDANINPDIPGVDKPGQQGGVIGGNNDAQLLSTGGRFTERTKAEIAEDGGTEYVIPINKEDRAIPLIRQMLQEISPSARNNILGDMPLGEGNSTSGNMYAGEKSSSGSGSMNRESGEESLSARAAQMEMLTAPQSISTVVNQNSQNVSAPVSINVNASGVSAEEIGETVYDTAEKYLLRALRTEAVV